jgi:hypothetical protein
MYPTTAYAQEAVSAAPNPVHASDAFVAFLQIHTTKMSVAVVDHGNAATREAQTSVRERISADAAHAPR